MKDILVILMMAFGLFAISMFVLFYVYLKKNYNKRHLSDDYHEDVSYDDRETKENIINEDFVPKKKVIKE